MIKPRIIGENYMVRWYLLPRNPLLGIMLHKFIGSDDDRATHDHPWWSVSVLLGGDGELYEIYRKGDSEQLYTRKIRRWVPVFRRAKHKHRLVLLGGPVYTLFITGPVIRSWGFYCPRGWVHHKVFTDATGNGIGKGCD